jgi:hypothetical protein
MTTPVSIYPKQIYLSTKIYPKHSNLMTNPYSKHNLVITKLSEIVRKPI